MLSVVQVTNPGGTPQILGWVCAAGIPKPDHLCSLLKARKAYPFLDKFRGKCLLRICFIQQLLCFDKIASVLAVVFDKIASVLAVVFDKIASVLSVVL